MVAMSTGSGRLPIVVGLIIIAGLVGTIAYILLTPPEPPEAGTVDTGLAEPDSKASKHVNQPPLLRATREASDEGDRRPAKKMRKLPNAEARAVLARAIAEARVRRERTEKERHDGAGDSPVGGSTEQPEEPPRGKLSKEYIRGTVREAIPLIKECYHLALEENPELSGRLDVNFTISGEPDVGGLVEESDVVAEEGLAYNETLEDCVRETVYTLEFPPPEGGGVVKVRYPLRFRPRDEEEAAE